MKKYILVFFGAVLISLIVIARPILVSGSGYAAKNICSGHYISGFSPETIVEQALVGASPLLKYTAYELTPQGVNTTLFGFFPRQAHYRDGLGCTLLPPNGDLAVDTINTLKSQNVDLPVSLNPDLDALLNNAFLETDPLRPRNTKAIVVLHHGVIVSEQYAAGITSSTPLLGWSMAKSITNMVAGLLVADEKLQLDAPLAIPEWSDERKDITLRHLLQMSSGLSFDEDYGLFSDVTNMLSSEADMASFAINQPLVAPPGTQWAYASGTSNIITHLAKRALAKDNTSFHNFLSQRLLQPLGIESLVFEVDASGNPIGSSYIYASARDWAKLGLLFQQQGKWQGQQILNKQWVEFSVTPAPSHPANNYGAHWWLNREPSDPSATRSTTNLSSDTYAMNGYQGQSVLVVPSKALVVVRLGFTPRGNAGNATLVKEILEALDT